MDDLLVHCVHRTWVCFYVLRTRLAPAQRHLGSVDKDAMNDAKGSKAIKVIKKVGKALWIILISYLAFLGLLSIADIAMCPVDYL